MNENFKLWITITVFPLAMLCIQDQGSPMNKMWQLHGGAQSLESPLNTFLFLPVVSLEQEDGSFQIHN